MQRLHDPLLDTHQIELYVKREDLLHPQLGGNKWHKLKYNLEQAIAEQHDTLLTFGGAWSNHIHATAAAGKLFGFHTIGVIRGDEAVSNRNLEFAQDCGMQLHFIDRQQYRNKCQATFIDSLHQRFGRFYLIPEGGSNALAVKGCAELAGEIHQPFDVITTACGTGATLAGLASGLSASQQAIGYAVLKGADFLRDDVTRLLQQNGTMPDNWDIETAYHFGGYARTTAVLFEFMQDFSARFGFELDAVYTAKMFYGLFNDIRTGRFAAGSRIVALHSGGLQGNAGFASTTHLRQS